MGIVLQNFKIKVAEPKKKKSSSYLKQGKVCQGVVTEDYKVIINLDKSGNKNITIPFTEESYDVVGRGTVFLRNLDKNGRRIRIIRNERDAKFHPGFKEQYIPFAPNWVVKGYLIKENGVMYFHFKDLIGINGYVVQ